MGDRHRLAVRLRNTVTAGIVLGQEPRDLSGDPNLDAVPFMQTDVAVNPGNSGGPLFNMNGEVVGINSQIFSRTGSYAGISFAIPIDYAVNVIDQLKKTGKVTRGRIGVAIQNVTKDLADSLGLRARRTAPPWAPSRTTRRPPRRASRWAT